MDDIMYVPLRRAFIRPITSFYAANYSSANVGDTVTKMSFKDVVSEIGEQGKELAYELTPRNVTSDDIRDFIKDNDFTTREQHYFSYIRSKKAAEANPVDEEEYNSGKPKYASDDYKKLRNTSYGDILKTYHEGKTKEAEEYHEFDTEMDMLKIIRKPKKKVSKDTKEFKAELESLFGKDQEANSKGAQLLDRSQKYQSPADHEQHLRKMEQIKQLERLTQERPEEVTPETISKFIDAYQGDLSVREVKNRDMRKLSSLRAKATQPMESNDNNTNQPTTQESNNVSERLEGAVQPEAAQPKTEQPSQSE